MQLTGSAVRAANRASVVDILRREGSATRAHLLRVTGLSRATVSSLVSEMRAEGLLSESRPATADGRGRPPATLVLNRSAGLAIGVDIGVRHLAVAVGDLARRVLAERWISLPHGHSADHGAPTVLRCIHETLVEAHADPAHLVGAAISIAAPVSTDSGRLMVPGVLPGWNGQQLANLVGERWNIPVAVENDANLGALGEYTWGELHGTESMLYVKIASRLGLGIVIDGSIYHGAQGSAGEFGHITVDPDGERCWCGRRGCLEMYVGGEALLRQLDVADEDEVDMRELLRYADDPRTREVLDRAGTLLAQGLSTLALLFNPTAITIGGELAALGDLLLDPARKAMEAVPFGTPIPVRLTTLDGRASVVGALALVLSDTARFTDRAAASGKVSPAHPTHPLATQDRPSSAFSRPAQEPQRARGR